jgi:hypothetical protein
MPCCGWTRRAGVCPVIIRGKYRADLFRTADPEPDRLLDDVDFDEEDAYPCSGRWIVYWPGGSVTTNAAPLRFTPSGNA